MKYIIGILIALSGWMPQLRAATDGEEAKPREPLFVLSVMKEKDPEYGRTILKNVLQTDTYKVVFETPRDWRMVADERDQKVGFDSRGMAAAMYFRIQPPGPGSTNAVELPSLKELRASVLTDHPGAEITDAFPYFVRGMKGQGFRLTYTGNGGLYEKVIQVASDAGFIEFDLKYSGEAKLPESDFNSLVNSFTIEVVKRPVPDESKPAAK